MAARYDLIVSGAGFDGASIAKTDAQKGLEEICLCVLP